MAKTPDALVAVAESQLGYDRFKDPEQGTKYGRWYAELTGSPWFGTNGVPFCMMGASWSCAQLQLTCFGLPTASCTPVAIAARNAGKLIRASEMRRGDLVLYDWSAGGYWSDNSDHVGIVTTNYSSSLSAVEFNVDNGKVLRRDRDHRYVVGGIRPNFDASPTPTPSKEDDVYGFPTIKRGSEGDAVKLVQSALNIRQHSEFWVDGKFGPYTESEVRRWQKDHHLIVDGIVANQTWTSLLGK